MQQARELFLQLAGDGITPKAIEDARKDVESAAEVRAQPDVTTRARSSATTTTNLAQRALRQRATSMGPDAQHGTHVVGIIGAVRGNGVGVDGIAPPGTRVMMLRAVPDGDERDKDVANAIRYAVDHGAHIINMSFGKAYSPQKGVGRRGGALRRRRRACCSCTRPATTASDIAREPSFPTPFYLGGGRAQNWIEVGASSWKGGDQLAASFSNYGRARRPVRAGRRHLLDGARRRRTSG